jgi:hypothetical protein
MLWFPAVRVVSEEAESPNRDPSQSKILRQDRSTQLSHSS